MSDRPLLRYYGSKNRLAAWIVDNMPPHECYVEPFFGSGAVFFAKPPAPLSVVNDLDSDVINFFRVLRDQPGPLIRAISLTPFSRQELKLARKLPPSEDPVENARRFYTRCWLSWGGKPHQNKGWSHQRTLAGRHLPYTDEFNDLTPLLAVIEKLKGVQIDCDSAEKVIARFDGPEVLFYVDPPYVGSTRYHKRAYRHEMDEAGHKALAEQLRGVQGRVAVSGYASTLYDELYQGWRVVKRSSQDVNGGSQVECLWLNEAYTSTYALPLFKWRNDGEG